MIMTTINNNSITVDNSSLSENLYVLRDKKPYLAALTAMIADVNIITVIR